jgi:hypothetical protein
MAEGCGGVGVAWRRGQRERRSGRRGPVGGRAVRRMVCLAAVGVPVGAVAQTAGARWTHVSLTPSKTEPYFGCPPKPGRASCQTIVDPIPKKPVRGPLRAGADGAEAGEWKGTLTIKPTETEKKSGGRSDQG